MRSYDLKMPDCPCPLVRSSSSCVHMMMITQRTNLFPWWAQLVFEVPVWFHTAWARTWWRWLNKPYCIMFLWIWIDTFCFSTYCSLNNITSVPRVRAHSFNRVQGQLFYLVAICCILLHKIIPFIKNNNEYHLCESKHFTIKLIMC